MENYLRTTTNLQIGLLIVMHIVFTHFNTVCFCRQNLQTGGVCIFFFRKDLCFRNFNISHDYKEKDLEICAVELETRSSKLIILLFYRAPTGDFNQFIQNLHDTLKHLYKPRANL
jgi:hypothetical protein